MIHRAIIHLVLLGLGSVKSAILEVESTHVASCNGSLHLSIQGSNRTVSYVRRGELNSVNDINTTRILKARVEGCGCVIIYSSKGARGQSTYLRPPQTVQEGDRSFFRTVKSFMIVRCSSKSSNMLEVVVVSVVVAVLLVGLGGVIFIRRKRPIAREESDSVEVTDLEEIPDCSKQNHDSPPNKPNKPEDKVKESEM